MDRLLENTADTAQLISLTSRDPRMIGWIRRLLEQVRIITFRIRALEEENEQLKTDLQRAQQR